MSSRCLSNNQQSLDVIKTEKIREIPGLHIDWLIRAQRVKTLETLVYLSQQREKWINEDQKDILTILQEYEKSGGDCIAENDPPPMNIKRQYMPDRISDSQELYEFTCRFLRMVKEEPVIWDRVNSKQFGFHQPMRQAWCSISLKLGGWGTIQHVQMLKQLYRRKRDQYNFDFLRHGRPFLYSENLNFLKNMLEMAKTEGLNQSINIEEHVRAAAPDIDFDSEILEAPDEVQKTLKKVSDSIEKVTELFPPDALAEYLSICCNEVVRNREEMATAGLTDSQWVDPTCSVYSDDSD